MTSSETPTDADPAPASDAAPASEPVAAVAAPVAAPVAAEPVPAAPVPAARTVRRRAAQPPWVFALALLPPGWIYVLREARWHLTASSVILMLCWGAIVATGYWAVRMALAAAAEDDEGWFAVRGKREELEREKRTLLKAIKEIEFDHQTGKLSAADAATLTASYRARAIEVIKAIEAEDGAHASLRERILADVRARAAIDAKVKTKKSKGKKESAA